MATQAPVLQDKLDPAFVRAEFRRRRGHWHDDWEALLAYSPAYVAAYLDFSVYALERGNLPPKFIELLYVATNCAPTHMFAKGLRNHARQALDLGATPAELLSVAATVSAMGIHSYLLVAQAVAELVPDAAEAGDREAIARAAADHASLFGEVLAQSDAAIRIDPQFYACWLDFAAAPVRGPRAALSIKEGHLISLAVHAQCTQLNPSGVQLHARGAIAHGASAQEVLDVGRLISSMGIHAMVFARPIIEELTQEGPA
ncbi:gamma-carboxymuconolactone decarboxylase subunit [Novosphingobium sp. Rr 2-17]|uniref:carboxymuconolactone decarboxylase family protein n=1 Tax=Novosphingobium sp. Rr 2-17 TaxID=555793 RepID=UPI0002697BA6|nr:carboxymuconolactone decarboxylase family protein [Novosphingobium sp. Rr 2-17]EIZ78338.1 gamma-carboxymuconolactone decarboxylase subunit [Novosphingobium sp. Rr 2-17]